MEIISFEIELDTIILEQAIKLRTSIGSHLIKVEYSFIPDHIKNLGYQYEEDNLLLHFDKALLADERDEIVNLVNNLNDEYDLVARDKLQKNIIKDKMVFGKNFMEVFAANNAYRNKTAQQIGGMLAKYPSLITCCLTGSIETLYGLLLIIEADENISQEEIDEFRKRVEIFLGGLNG